MVEEGICIYGRGVLLKHLQALAQEIEGVQSGAADIEYIHRMRVASRRLRSAFRLFPRCLPPKKHKGWLKQIKQVTRALGESRDSDVQIECLQAFANTLTVRRHRAGIDRLLMRLQQRRQRLQPELSRAMQKLKESGLLNEMQNHLALPATVPPEGSEMDPAPVAPPPLHTPALYRHAFMAISAGLEEFLSFDSIVPQPEKVEELHAMRISAKHLRYTLENLASLYPGGLKSYIQVVRKAQEILGDVHDCDVWIAFLPRFMEEEKQRILEFYNHTRAYSRLVSGIQHFAEDRAAMRLQQYENFVARWQRWKEEVLWSQLKQEIRAPFLPSNAGRLPESIS